MLLVLENLFSRRAATHERKGSVDTRAHSRAGNERCFCGLCRVLASPTARQREKYMRHAHSPLPDAIKRGNEAVCIRLQQGNLAADYLRMPFTRAHDRT